MPTTYQKIGKGLVLVLEVLLKNWKSAVLTHTDDPYGSPEMILTICSLFMSFSNRFYYKVAKFQNELIGSPKDISE